MLNRIPRHLPDLPTMLEDIGNPKTEALARALGVSPSTARRWIAAGSAPTPVMQAIFWLTSWGQHAVHCEAHNAAIMHASMTRLLRIELAEMAERLRRIEGIADFGSANDPAEAIRQLQRAVAPIHADETTLPLPLGTGSGETDQSNQLEAPEEPVARHG
jgi:hypothetical protein